MNKKLAIVLIALVGIGIFALPSTVALFSGQHTFTNIDPTGNQIDCKKCHGDVQAELDSSMSTLTGTPGAHAAFKCEFCHRIEAGASTGDNAYAQFTFQNQSATTDGVTVKRILVTTVMDMEGKNIPITITSGATFDNIRNLSTISGNPMYRNTSTSAQLSISPCYPSTAAGCVDTTTVMIPPELPSWKPTALYAAGIPKDTSNTTKNGGFSAKLVTWTVSNSGLANESQTVNLTGAGSRTVNPGTSYHAASTVSCMECHRGAEPMGHYSRVADGADTGNQCQKCHYGTSSSAPGVFTRSLWAGGFGLTGIQGDTGATEAHNEFVKTDDLITRFEYGASNGACVACHTHVEVNIKYSKPSVYQFDANFFTDGNESLGGFGAQAPMITSYSPANATPR